jgi:hypothetical protein
MKVAAFVNLEKGDETDNHRFLALQANLPPDFTFGDPTHPHQYGGGDFNGYSRKANKLINDHSDADVFFASCWNTLSALDSALNTANSQKPVVYAGMVVNSNVPPRRARGIMAFDCDKLCPYWPALLKAQKPGITKAAVVYDSFRDVTKHQRDVINRGPLSIIEIPADDGHGNKRDIYQAITTDTRLNQGDGLIVTACTITGLLREDICRAANDKKLISIGPERMYVQRTSNPLLMSYGPDLLDLYAIAARDIIPNWARGFESPPINPPYELVVNATVAAQLGQNIGPLNVTVSGQTTTITPKVVR